MNHQVELLQVDACGARAMATTGVTTKVTYYDAADLVEIARPWAGSLQDHFKTAGYYSKSIFFLAPLFHRLLPEAITELIVLDSDLKFTTDIGLLHGQFERFGTQTVMALAYVP